MCKAWCEEYEMVKNVGLAYKELIWSVELFINCIARHLALLKRRTNNFNHNTRQHDLGTIVARQMKEAIRGSLKVEVDFH